MAQNIDATSSDYKASRDYWLMVSTMLAGAQAMRDAGELYLPRFESEGLKAYRLRAKHAKFTNIFGDIVDNLAARPFAKELKVEKASGNLTKYMEDVDGMKNHVHKFTSKWFKEAVAKGIAWVFVDMAQASTQTVGADGQVRKKTLAEERASGARPYLILVKPEDVIAVYSAFIDGVEKFTHVRFRETSVELVNYEEQTVERIRELNRAPILDDEGNIIGYGDPTFVVWKKDKGGSAKAVNWTEESSGSISIGEIAMVPLIIGERDVGWHVIAAMNDAAELQKEYYDAENGVKNLKTLTGYPMLTASGVNPEMENEKIEQADGTFVTVKKPKKAPVGPRSVLYAPANEISGAIGQWSFIEPAGTSLSFLSGDLKDLEKSLRELGRQPLTANSANLTVVTTAFAAAKGNAAIQSWALDCKDALETALMYMSWWDTNTSNAGPTVTIPLDFALETGEDKTFTNVATMRKDGDLSRKTMWKEAMRRKILSDDFDPEQEEKDIEEEMPGEPTMEDNMDGLPTDQKIDPETGLPIEEEVMSPADEDADGNPIVDKKAKAA